MKPSEGAITNGMFRLRGIETVKLDAVRELLLAADRWQSAVNSSFGLESRQEAEIELMRAVEHWRQVRHMTPAKMVGQIPRIPLRIVRKKNRPAVGGVPKARKNPKRSKRRPKSKAPRSRRT